MAKLCKREEPSGCDFQTTFAFLSVIMTLGGGGVLGLPLLLTTSPGMLNNGHGL